MDFGSGQFPRTGQTPGLHRRKRDSWLELLLGLALPEALEHPGGQGLACPCVPACVGPCSCRSHTLPFPELTPTHP